MRYSLFSQSAPTPEVILQKLADDLKRCRRFNWVDPVFTVIPFSFQSYSSNAKCIILAIANNRYSENAMRACEF